MPTFSENVGEVIKRKRKRYRFTQTELGGRIGVSGSYISSLETGQASPRLEELESLATQFHTTALDLIHEAVSFDARVFQPDTHEKQKLLALFDSLPAERRRQATEYLVFLTQLERGEGSADAPG